MGWTYQAARHYKKNGSVDRKTECDELLTYTSASRTQKVLRSSMKGSTYYAAVETIYTDGVREVWAAVFLTAGADRSDPYFNFGYKDMDETCGPYKYDCPKSILDLLTPTDNETANDWRRKCREGKAENKLKALNIGDKVLWKGHTLIKHAPAFQFKTWFWYCLETGQYVKKTLVNDNNAEIISA